MSGHSKWSKIKHQKEITDAVKGKIFTKIANVISISVREGGGVDPVSNFKLRLAIEKARAVNMPKEKIERAIERGVGAGNGVQLVEVVYEAIGPEGVGIMIEATTDNKQRTVAMIKTLLDKNGGILAASGAVSHMFSYVGQISVSGSVDTLMEAALSAGAIDIVESNDIVEIYTQPAELHTVKQSLTNAGIAVNDAELVYRPSMVITVSQRDHAETLLKLLNLLEEADDVQKVFANFDMPEEYLVH
jgi:YebC/PmpR family DNA-binding regulatory protein